MNFTPASNLSLISFIILIIFTWSLVIYKIRDIEGFKKWISIYFSLTLIISFSAFFNLTRTYIIPLAPLYLVGNIIFSISLSSSSFGNNIVSRLNYRSLLGINSFRLPLELILHSWFISKTIPELMTWSGQNFDIFAGILCLVGIPFFNKSKTLVIIIQSISFILLLNVIRVAVMSSPFPFSWKLENPLQLIFEMPYALIVPLFVTFALNFSPFNI